MKHLRKIALATIIISTFATSGVFADEANTSTSNSWTTKKWIMLQAKEAKQKIKDAFAQRKEERKTLIENNQKLRDEAKQNREEFKAENNDLKEILKKLDKDIQAQIITLSQEHRKSVDLLQEELTNSGTTESRKVEIKNQIKTLREAHFAKVIELAWSTDEIKAYFEKRSELIAENETLRAHAKQARVDFREWQNAIIDQYKTQYFNQLKNVIPKVSDTKLEIILIKVDAMITKLDSNTAISEERKTKTLAQLTSLKEIIQEEQETRATNDEELNVTTILE